MAKKEHTKEDKPVDPVLTAEAAQAKDDEALAREAATLGVTVSRVTISTSPTIKNPQAEADRHAALVKQRTKKRIEKAKKPAKTLVQARKAFLTARLGNTGWMTLEQIRQCKYELSVIKQGNWFAPTTGNDGRVNCIRAPKKLTPYEKVAAM